jgi:hypothetical protein
MQNFLKIYALERKIYAFFAAFCDKDAELRVLKSGDSFKRA